MHRTTVYAVVVIPVAICRMGVLAGWQPPFGLLVFAGICFGSSGVYSQFRVLDSQINPSPHFKGLSNTVLFLTTRKSFITHANRVPTTDGIRITTQIITLRDHSTCNDGDIELSSMKPSGAQLVSPSSANGPVVFYSGHSREEFDSDEERRDHKAEDEYASCNWSRDATIVRQFRQCRSSSMY